MVYEALSRLRARGESWGPSRNERSTASAPAVAPLERYRDEMEALITLVGAGAVVYHPPGGECLVGERAQHRARLCHTDH